MAEAWTIYDGGAAWAARPAGLRALLARLLSRDDPDIQSVLALRVSLPNLGHDVQQRPTQAIQTLALSFAQLLTPALPGARAGCLRAPIVVATMQPPQPPAR